MLQWALIYAGMMGLMLQHMLYVRAKGEGRPFGWPHFALSMITGWAVVPAIIATFLYMLLRYERRR